MLQVMQYNSVVSASGVPPPSNAHSVIEFPEPAREKLIFLFDARDDVKV